MGWWTRKGPPCVGLACFPGTVPPPDAFAHLAAQGVRVQPGRTPGRETRLRLSHASWGEAELIYPVDPPGGPLLDWDRRLIERERVQGRLAGWAAALTLESVRGHILEDRKNLLRFLRVSLGSDGVVAFDATAQTFWSPAALFDELSHDAELDIEALFTLHLVQEPAATSAVAYWLHTHGLKEIGFTDFDVLDPSPDLGARQSDLFRALAFAIVEGTLSPEGSAFEAVSGVLVRLVPVSAYRARADPRSHPLWRRDVDDEHTQGHAVVCDPAPGFLGRWRDRPRASAFLSGPMPEDALTHLSTEATVRMAHRARETYSLLREVAEELREFDLPVMVKLSFPVEGSRADREHLWFQVHTLTADQVEATLVNQPVGVPSMKPGDRGRHGVESLSDWAILTPLGMINPRWTVALRQIRESPDEFRRLVESPRETKSS